MGAISLGQACGRSIRTPETWYETLSPAALSLEIAGPHPALLKHFTAIQGELEQPPLNAHVVAIHLGGPKRVRRTQGRRHWVQDVPSGAMTLMPAYQENSWQTEGPIEFAHLTLSVGTVEQIVVEEFEREPATHQLHDTVGVVDPLLEQVFLELLTQGARGRGRRLLLDSLLIVFAASLLARHSTLSNRSIEGPCDPVQRRGGLAGWQLRRVIDCMHAQIGTDMPLGALASLTGLSRAHFYRAFRQSTGHSPGKFLGEMRMRHAMALLRTTVLPIDEVANALGFHHKRHFATAFTRQVGVSPRLYRASHE